MAYQLEYELHNIRITKRSFKKEAMAVLIGVVVLSVIVMGAYFGGAACFAVLTEGGQNTLEAAEHLVDDLRTGVPLQEAVQVFCEEIIQ